LRLSRLAAENMTARVLQTTAAARLTARVNGPLLATRDTCAAALADGVSVAADSVANAFVVQRDGTVVCSLSSLPATLPVDGREYLTSAFASGQPAAGVEPAGVLVGSPALVVSQPLTADLLFAIAIDLDADLGAIAERFALPENSTVTLLDAQGVVVGNWPPTATGEPNRLDDTAEQIEGGSVEGTTVERGADGVSRVYSFVDIAQTGRSVYAVVGIPTSWAFEEANRELRTNLIALAIIAVITIGLAVLLAERWINRHLRAIAVTTRRIGAGDLTARVGPRHAASELSELAVTVDQMANDLHGREVALRSATAERARLVDELLDVQEDERRRIAADIHDDTIQTVVACGMSAQLLRGRLADPQALAQADQLADRLAAATARLRQLTFDLDPAANGLGLAESLDRYLVGALDGRSVTLLVSADVSEDPQGPVRQVVFRNVREAVLNAASHGAAHRVTVVVEEERGGLRVDVTDDGVGFDPDPRGWPGHQGVRTMRHRAEALGGWFDMRSVRGTGTRVSFWLPLAMQDQLEPGAPVRSDGVEMIGVG
jgi:signal transduction histidine kinase